MEVDARKGDSHKYYEVYDSFGERFKTVIYANSDTGVVEQAALDDKGRVRVDGNGDVLFLRWKPPGGICISPKRVK